MNEDKKADEMIEAFRPLMSARRLIHRSDCAIYNEPESPAGPCDCHLSDPTVPAPLSNLDLRDTIRDLCGALETACSLIESAERETNWVSGDPYGDSAVVELRAILSKAREDHPHG